MSLRSKKMNGYIGNFESSFLSCEKDTEEIVKRLFITSRPYSDMLKRLLVINTKDCMDDLDNQVYEETLRNMSVKDLIDKGYIRFKPKLGMQENEEVRSYLVITFDNFTPNATNPYYRDCTIMIDVICHTDYWELTNYRQRPLKIMGYVDGILNGSRLSGIGTLNFLGASELVLTEELSGYCLVYSATHGIDDAIPVEDEFADEE